MPLPTEGVTGGRTEGRSILRALLLYRISRGSQRHSGAATEEKKEEKEANGITVAEGEKREKGDFASLISAQSNSSRRTHHRMFPN